MSVLTTEAVGKRYGKLTALSDVSVSVPRGEIHGLIGPNGSGKSTLLKCLSGLIKPSSGRVMLLGNDITTASPSRRSRLGLSIKFQITSIFPALTVTDNLLLSTQGHDGFCRLLFSSTRDRHMPSVERLLDLFRLRGRADELAANLSHGEQQWLEIAMAVSTRPKLLLLDEPTAGMSVVERQMTGQVLRQVVGDCSIVIVEHDLDFIRGICDRVTVLDQGRVIFSGGVSDLQSSETVRQIYIKRV